MLPQNFYLSTREISTLVWGAIILCWCLKSKDLRQSILSLIRAFFNFKLQIIFWSFILWIVICCYFLHILGVWKYSYSKDVFLWSFVSIFGFMNSTITKYEINIFNEIKNGLSFSAIYGFFITFYSFDLWIELLLVPFIGLLFLIHTLAGTRQEWHVTKKALDWILAFVGFIYLSFYSWYFYHNISSNVFYEQIEIVLLIFLLTFLLFPIFYFWVMFSMYENLLILFQASWFKDKQDIVIYAKTRIYRYCHFNYLNLKSLHKNSQFRGALFNTYTKEDIDRVFEAVTHPHS